MPEKKNKDRFGLAIPAGLFIGMGLGFLLGNLVAWMFIGMGAGFLVALLASLSKSRKR